MASATVTKRIIEVDVRLSKEAAAHLKAMNASMKKVEKSTISIGKNFSNVFKGFIAYNIIGKSAQWVSSFVDLGDSMASLEARLSLVTEGSQDLDNVMNSLFETAERSRTSIESVGKLYTRLAVSTKDLGTSQQQLLDFTELVSDTFLLSGATASEASSGVLQLSQAMAKGRLDGDEFRNMMEGNVYLADLLAKSLGVTRGGLLEMSKAGQITTTDMLRLTDALDDVQSKVGAMPITVGQAATQLENAWAKLSQELSGFNDVLIDTIKLTTDGVNKLAKLWAFLKKPLPGTEPTSEQAWAKTLEDMRDVEAEITKIGSGLKGLSHISGSGWYKSEQDKLTKLTRQLIEYKERQYAVEGLTKGAPPPTVLTTFDSETNAFIAEGEKAFEKDINAMRKESIRMMNQLQTSNEKYQESLEKVNDQLKFGVITEEQAAESKSRLTAEYQKSITKTKELTEAQKAFKQAQEDIAETFDSMKDPMDRFVDKLDRLEVIMREHPEIASDAQEAWQALWDSFDAVDMDSKKDEFIDWARVAKSGISGVSGAFVDMAWEGKNSFQDFADSFLKNIAQMILQAAVLKSLQGTTLGGWLGVAATADGNAFNNGKITPFATGGVIDQPTLFPMASGAGLMGEAGPEAVMPLKRGADGKLGVSAEGGTGTVNQTINVTGTGDKDLIAAMAAAAQEGYQLAMNDVRRNGPMRRMMGV